jgi:hypothetical protein
MNNVYIDPFDYYSRRRNKNIEGKIVYVRRKREGNIEVLTDPFLVIAKIKDKIYAVRMRDQIKTRKITWSQNQRWALTANYMIEGKEDEDIFFDKLPTSEFEFTLPTAEEERTFNIDMNKIYVIRHIKEYDVEGEEDVWSDQRTFNNVIGRYTSYCPTSFIAEYYNFTNWEEGN